MLCYAMLCYAMLCYTILYYTILYYTILYYTILYYTIHYMEPKTGPRMTQLAPARESARTSSELASASVGQGGWGLLSTAGSKPPGQPKTHKHRSMYNHKHIYSCVYIYICAYFYIYMRVVNVHISVRRYISVYSLYICIYTYTQVPGVCRTLRSCKLYFF